MDERTQASRPKRKAEATLPMLPPPLNSPDTSPTPHHTHTDLPTHPPTHPITTPPTPTTHTPTPPRIVLDLLAELCAAQEAGGDALGVKGHHLGAAGAAVSGRLAARREGMRAGPGAPQRHRLAAWLRCHLHSPCPCFPTYLPAPSPPPPPTPTLPHLVLHEGNEGADHHRWLAQHQRRHLVAQRLAAAGRLGCSRAEGRGRGGRLASGTQASRRAPHLVAPAAGSRQRRPLRPRTITTRASWPASTASTTSCVVGEERRGGAGIVVKLGQDTARGAALPSAAAGWRRRRYGGRSGRQARIPTCCGCLKALKPQCRRKTSSGASCCACFIACVGGNRAANRRRAGGGGAAAARGAFAWMSARAGNNPRWFLPTAGRAGLRLQRTFKSSSST